MKEMKHAFKVVSEYEPKGDQGPAIKKIAKGIQDGLKYQTLLGVTGSGKTYTMAKVIEAVQKPTLVIAHRLATIRNADLILVFQHGHIIERGTFVELAQGDGFFSRLVAAQSDSLLADPHREPAPQIRE